MPPELASTRRQFGALTAVTAGGVLSGLAGTAAAPGCRSGPDVGKHQFRALWIASVVNIGNIGQVGADYAKLVPWWNDQVNGTDVHLYIGEATYEVGAPGACSKPAELSAHLTLDRDYPGVLTTVRDRGFLDATARAGRTYTYYVTALDRLSAESESAPCPVV